MSFTFHVHKWGLDKKQDVLTFYSVPDAQDCMVLNQCMILSSGLVVQSDHLGTFKIHRCPELRTYQWCQIFGLQCPTNLPQVIFVCSLVEGYQVRGDLSVAIETFEDIPKGLQRKESGNKIQKLHLCDSKKPWIVCYIFVAFAISASRRMTNTSLLLHGRSIRWVTAFPFVFVLPLSLTPCGDQTLLAVWLKMSFWTPSCTPVFCDILAQAFSGSVKTKWGNI